MPLKEVSYAELMSTVSHMAGDDRARLAPLIDMRADGETASMVGNRPTGTSEEDEQYLPVSRLRTQYIDFLGQKVAEIEEQKEARRYYHMAHWTAAEVRILRARGQPVISVDRLPRKINGIVGLLEKLRLDPKAFPNKPKAEDGAEVATATVRSVLDGNDWKTKDAECARHAAVEGISGVELRLIEGDQGDPDIGIEIALGDDYFYDYRSVRYDFSDKRFDGIAKWIDIEEAVELFPDKEELLRGLLDAGSDLTTNADREFKWLNTQEKRIRLVEHWYKYRGKWRWAFYVSHTLLDEGVSPFFDERGKTMSRFIMFSAAVDHDGDRYGFVRNLKGMQDEVNQRRSKALHLSNSRRLIGEKGAVDDVETARREWARPDGYLETNPGKTITPDNTTQDLENQFRFLEDAKNELQQFANIDIANLSPSALGNLSGRAVSLLQQPGLAELGPFILSYRGWKLRVYRAIWNTALRYWKAQRWIRVTEEQEGVQIARFMQVNGMEVDEFGRPMLVNMLGGLHVDISLDEGPDVVNMMQDTYDVLRNQPPGTVPPQVLIELAPIQGSQKKRILDMLAPKPVPVDPVEAVAKQLMLAGQAAQNEKLRAEAEEKSASADQKRAGVYREAASAAHLASQAHLAPVEFAWGAIKDVIAANSAEAKPDAPASAEPPMPAMPIPMPMAPPSQYPAPFNF